MHRTISESYEVDGYMNIFNNILGVLFSMRLFGFNALFNATIT